MKRRLDLALALVHSPRILFLDEPTTGLDPQSRTDIWNEVALMRREAGVTVFLTTQYLEEADVLADRVGIIDAGKIVAEGTPAELKAEIGRPSVHAIPRTEDDRPKIAAFLAQFGEPLASTRDVAVRLTTGSGSPTSSGPSMPTASTSPTSSCTRRRSTTSSSRRPGRTLEGAAEEAESAGAGAAAQVSSATFTQVGAIARRSVVRTSRQPASIIPPLIFPVALMAVNAGGLRCVDEPPGLPDRLVPRVRARGSVHPGRALLDDERGHRYRARCPDGLRQPPLAHGAA